MHFETMYIVLSQHNEENINYIFIPIQIPMNLNQFFLLNGIVCRAFPTQN